MKKSLAMTTYNGEKYLVKQLDSLKNQTVPFDEVLIFDDCSKDRTAETVKEYIAQNNLTHWKFYQNQTNMGFVKNFINAILSTTGDIVFLCDQDDEWDSDKVELITEKMESNPEIKVLNTSLRFIDENGNEKDVASDNVWVDRINDSAERLEAFSSEQLSQNNISPGCTMCIRKEVKEQLKMFSDFERLPHDWLLNLIGSGNNGTYYWNKKLMGYRIHSSNTLGLSDGNTHSLKDYGTVVKEAGKMSKLSQEILEVYRKLDLKMSRKTEYFYESLTARYSYYLNANPASLMKALKKDFLSHNIKYILDDLYLYPVCLKNKKGV